MGVFWRFLVFRQLIVLFLAKSQKSLLINCCKSLRWILIIMHFKKIDKQCLLKMEEKLKIIAIWGHLDLFSYKLLPSTLMVVWLRSSLFPLEFWKERLINNFRKLSFSLWFQFLEIKSFKKNTHTLTSSILCVLFSKINQYLKKLKTLRPPLC